MFSQKQVISYFEKHKDISLSSVNSRSSKNHSCFHYCYKKLSFLFISLIVTLPIFSVNYEAIRKNGFNEWVVIAPKDKTTSNLKELGDLFREQNLENTTAFVYIYDDIKAARMWDRIDNLSDSESDFYDKHFIAVFWKGNGENTRYDFTITLDGLNGKRETIKYDRNEDRKENENKITEEKPETVETESDKKDYIPTKTDKILGMLPFVFIFGIIITLAAWKQNKYKVWFEFFVALFLGGFGVQKFREKRYALGVLYIFTGGCWLIGWLIDCVRYFVAAVRNKPILPVGLVTKKEIEQALSDTQKKMIEIIQSTGELPVVENAPIILNSKEICHYSQEAYYLETKNMVLGRKTTGGSRSTTFLGVRYSLGGAQSQSIRGDVTTQTAGILTITSERIIFTARKGAFSKKITELTSLVPEGETIGFQFGEKYYVLQTRTADLISVIIKAILQN